MKNNIAVLTMKLLCYFFYIFGKSLITLNTDTVEDQRRLEIRIILISLLLISQVRIALGSIGIIFGKGRLGHGFIA
jgi:hypothetical protein